MRSTARFAVMALVVLPQAIAAQAPILHRGSLAAGDQTLRSGEYFDNYTFEGRSGQRVVVDLTSSAFDPYLMVIAPSGDKKDNDDYEGSSSRSRIELTLEETGTYRVLVTSYEKGQSGDYELRIDLSGGAATTVAASTGGRLESGRLAPGDNTLRSGEYMDEYAFEGRRGQQATIDLRSSQFDPYLIVIDPADKHHENDDYAGANNRSLVSFELPADGRYRVLVTSYKKDESGAYDLRIDLGTSGAATVAAGPRLERGRLQAGDDTLRSGEYVDGFTFEGRPGQRVTLDVVSRDFDTYLMLIPPRGQRRENDDVEGRPAHSVIEADLTEAGTYKVAVTSYEKGEQGSYELRMTFGTAGGATAAGGDGPGARPRDVAALAYGETANGQLTADDQRLESGEYRDAFAFDGQSGDAIVIELQSSAFDPYLILVPPQGEQIDNDDADGRQDMSRVALTLRASGRYRVLVTTYAGGKTGAYRVSLRRGVAPQVAARPTLPATPAGPGPAPASGGTQRVYGVFVGISNYGGRASNLPYTADDARRARQAMARGVGMRDADAVMLVDAEATVANIRRAFENVARQAGPNDMFVFFYSGHGGRVPRQGFQPSDPDGKDETLSFFDADVIDDDFSQWLAPIRGRSLIVLDACFSGGFSKDIISAPGRMGLFSSEEDVTSGVAAKFRAGGYLAQFIFDGVGDRLADADGDRSITALELSQYLHERYRMDVKSSSGAEDFVRTGGPQSGYQHLVVDRGSIGPFDVLFR